MPDDIRTFEHFGGPKPDILFCWRGKPIFYVEAKLDSSTEPMQLTRARSKMRASGAADDQLLLISQNVDVVPSSIGWVGRSLPCPMVTWHKVLERFEALKYSWKAPAHAALDAFRATLNSYSSGARNKNKRLVLDSGHPYGAVMQAVTKRLPDVQAEFLYGGNIAPRVNFGLKSWQSILGSKDVERLSLQCSKRKDGVEAYGAAFGLWHTSDLIGSREAIHQNWQFWREAIMVDPSIKLHIGGRKEHERQYVDVPPATFPVGKVAVLRRPGSDVRVQDTCRLPFDGMVDRIAELVAPYIQIVRRVGVRLE